MTGAISGAVTAYPSGALDFTPVFSGIRVAFCLFVCFFFILFVKCFVDRCLSFFLVAIVLSGLLQFTDYDYPFGIFKLFLQKEKEVGQQFHQYQQNEQPPQTTEQLTKTKYGVGNQGCGLKTCKNIRLGLTSCMYFFLYCIIQYQISHTCNLDCCNYLRPSDVSYFTITLRNHWNCMCLWCFTCYFWDTRVFDLLPYHLSTASVSMLTSSAVVRGVKPLSGQTKDYKIGICYFSVKHAVYRSKSENCFFQNRVYESKWSDMSTRWQFQWTGTIKI